MATRDEDLWEYITLLIVSLALLVITTLMGSVLMTMAFNRYRSPRYGSPALSSIMCVIIVETIVVSVLHSIKPTKFTSSLLDVSLAMMFIANYVVLKLLGYVVAGIYPLMLMLTSPKSPTMHVITLDWGQVGLLGLIVKHRDALRQPISSLLGKRSKSEDGKSSH